MYFAIIDEPTVSNTGSHCYIRNNIIENESNTGLLNKGDDCHLVDNTCNSTYFVTESVKNMGLYCIVIGNNFNTGGLATSSYTYPNTAELLGQLNSGNTYIIE